MATLQAKEIFCLLYTAVLFLSGAVLISFAVVLTYKVLFYHFSFIPNNTIAPFLVIFVAGIVHLLITWIGIKGPSKEHEFFILLFIVLTLLLFIVECVVGVWALFLRAQVESRSLDLLRKSQEKYIQEYAMSKEKSEWVRLQSKFECCGIDNALMEYGPKVPPSCMRCESLDVVNKYRNCSETFQTGCKQPLVTYVRKLLTYIAIIAFLAGFLQVIGMALFIQYYLSFRAECAQRATNRANRHSTILHDSIVTNNQGYSSSGQTA